MKIVIIEDEPAVAKNFVKTLLEIAPEASIEAILPGVTEAITYFSSTPETTLIFADIQLSDGTSFDIFSRIHPKAPVIFTTAYDEYAIRAFQLNNIEYLVKPVGKKALQIVLDKFIEQKETWNPLPEQLMDLLSDIRKHAQGNKYKERFLARFNHNMVPVPESQVACFRKEQVIYLVTRDNKTMETDYETMEQIEAWVNPAAFFRANRQHIIHKDAILHYTAATNGKLSVLMKPPVHMMLDISREKAQNFKNWFL